MTAVERHTLANGLQVLLCPLRNIATVSAWVFYRVGSRNELPGGTGLSHWVEHMTYKAAGRFGKGQIAREVSRRGGIWNGFTYYDWTAYFETLPAKDLDLSLEIERERMCAVHFDPAEVEAERTVILSEREGAENDPAFLLQEEVIAQALRVHPYRQPIVGWKEDLQRLSPADLERHYQRYYQPNNALLVLAGAFEPQQALQRAAEQLGFLPAGEIPPVPRIVEPPQRAERRVVLRLPGPTPILFLAFPAASAADPDWLPLLVLEALLGGARGLGMFRRGPGLYRTSRLYRALVETGLAVSAVCQAPVTLDPGLFTIQVTLRAERRPEEVEPVLLRELERVAEAPPPEEEIARAARQMRAQIAYGSESATALAGWLGLMEVVGRSDPPERLLEDLAQVRPEEVQRVAAACFAPERRSIGWFLPDRQKGAPGVAENGPVAVRHPGASGEGAGRLPALRADEIVRFVLPGRAVLLVRENHTHPVVAVQGYIRGGSLLDPPGKEGLCALTAQMLLRGTRRRNFRELHEDLEGVGAGIDFTAGPHAISFAGKALAQDLELLLDRLVEMLREPAFDEREWQRRKGEALTQLRHLEDDPDYLADWALREALFPEGHPYHRRPEGTLASVAAIERADLEAFHRDHISPQGLVIAVCGAVRPEQVEQMLGERLAGWEGTPAEEPPVPRVARPGQIREVRRFVPGKSQASLVWGVPGLARLDPDYYAALLANVILGELGMMGRLGETVRDIQGLAYGIRSVLEAGVGAGPWLVHAGVAPENTQPAREAIVRVIERFLAEGPSDEEMADARAYLVGQLALRLETNDGVAAALLRMERYGLGADYLERFPSLLEAIPPEEVRCTAARYLSPTEYVVAIALPGP